MVFVNGVYFIEFTNNTIANEKKRGRQDRRERKFESEFPFSIYIYI